MKAWLKGGLIGAGAILLIIILDVFFLEYAHTINLFYLLNQFFSRIYNVLEMPIKGVVNLIVDDEWGWITAIVSILFYFLIGSLIGWIVGQIKNNKKKK